MKTESSLPAILQRLKEEPEWTPEQARDWTVQANVCTYAGLISMIEPLFARHNATRARLLAVVEALEIALDNIKYTSAGWPEFRLEEIITAKLAAALEADRCSRAKLWRTIKPGEAPMPGDRLASEIKGLLLRPIVQYKE